MSEFSKYWKKNFKYFNKEGWYEVYLENKLITIVPEGIEPIKNCENLLKKVCRLSWYAKGIRKL